MTRQVETRAAKAGDGPLIGYRRDPVRILHEGWELEIPGGFSERRTEDEWWGGEAGRSITLAATQTGTVAGPMSADDFLLQVAPDLGRDALSHRAGEVVGRARISTDATSGVEVGVLEGFSAVRGRGAVDPDHLRRLGRLAVGASTCGGRSRPPGAARSSPPELVRRRVADAGQQLGGDQPP